MEEKPPEVPAEKPILPGNVKNIYAGGENKMHFALPYRATERDYPAAVCGMLCEKPRICPFGSQKSWSQAKFRLIVARNEWPVNCVALFELADWVEQFDKGDCLFVSGCMRYSNVETCRSPRPVMQVSKIVRIPGGSNGIDLNIEPLMQKFDALQSTVQTLLDENRALKDAVDAYGIKMERKRDWREGAEPGSLW